ncbi:sigma-E processing peptidase SpoIIGA [Sporosarcina sp. NPDC096371]|uniref:sigma-E processing peptidase SpoIIGA n=1 Tax=Sporosarcina sp. NPDC096371 TaxID=3364530 RepID=UPI00381D203A
MYGELIVGVNMLFNYAILSFANKVGNVQAARGRLLFASFVGALPVTIFPSSAIAVVLSFMGMTLCAFGKAFEPWKKSAAMVLVGAVFAGGLLTAFHFRIQTVSSSLNVLSYAVVAYVALYFMNKKWLDVRTARHVSELKSSSTLHIFGGDIPIDVFIDSGNSCTEPLSGAPVHFIALKAVEKHLPEDLKESMLAWDPQGTPSLAGFPDNYQRSIRLIRLMTIQGRSWAVGLKFDQWTIGAGNTLQPGYIVLTKNDRRYPDGAEAILHVSAMESLHDLRPGAVQNL